MSTKAKLVLLEETLFTKNILATPNSMVEFSVMVWNDASKIVFEKKGKVAKEKLSENLVFDILPDVEHSVILDLNVVINNKDNPFVTLSPDNTILSDIDTAMNLDNGTINSVSTFTVPVQPIEGLTVDVLLYVVSEEGVNAYIKDNIGKFQITLQTELDVIKDLDLQTKRLVKKLELVKKQKFGVSYASDSENTLLTHLTNENTYVELQNLLLAYDVLGLKNLSEHRKNIYTALKQTVDNIVVLKGRLGSLIQTSLK